ASSAVVTSNAKRKFAVSRNTPHPSKYAPHHFPSAPSPALTINETSKRNPSASTTPKERILARRIDQSPALRSTDSAFHITSRSDCSSAKTEVAPTART